MKAYLVAHVDTSEGRHPALTLVELLWWRPESQATDVLLCSAIGNPEECKAALRERVTALYPWATKLMHSDTKRELGL